MRIVKSGRNAKKEFICRNCGCVFTADADEYNKYGSTMVNDLLLECDCPHCLGEAFESEGGKLRNVTAKDWYELGLIIQYEYSRIPKDAKSFKRKMFQKGLDCIDEEVKSQGNTDELYEKLLGWIIKGNGA